MKLFILHETGFTAACCICLDKQSRVLLGIATHNDDRLNKWCFPGGGIEPGEPPEKAAERECWEETGIKSRNIQPSFPYHKRPNVAFVICRQIGGDLKPNQEFSELKWFSIDQALKLKDLYPVNKEILRKI